MILAIPVLQVLKTYHVGTLDVGPRWLTIVSAAIPLALFIGATIALANIATSRFSMIQTGRVSIGS